MSMVEKFSSTMHNEDFASNTTSLPTDEKVPQLKVNSKGFVLVPQPSNDPGDPLNWTATRKLLTLVVVCLASFTSTLQALPNASGLVPQAILYQKTPVEISYGLSAAVAGLATGPFFWAPFAKMKGKCATIFWSTVLGMACNIWSACMTSQSQYSAWIVSRLFAGLLGSAATTVGAKAITETFFLHDRGKCLTIYSSSILFGTVASATFSGFIVQSASWTVQFWYVVGLQAFVALTVVAFMEETTWTRPDTEVYPPLPTTFVARRAALYLGTKPVTPPRPAREIWRLTVLPFKIGLCPSVMIVGFAIMIYFAWSIAVTTLLTVFLQEPLVAGGYAFSPARNASFTFTGWVSILAAQAYGHFVNDRLPLWLCSRRGGKWHPEYRLHALWFPVLFAVPLGCGLFGGCIHYHWNYMVLALAFFLIAFGAIAGIPPAVNYVVESVGRSMANECAVALNCYRLILGLAVPFFLFPWAEKVGVQWVFGTMAFLSIAAFAALGMLMLFGPSIRKLDFVHEKWQEDGLKLVQSRAD